MLKELLIGVTSFFRDSEAFEQLRKVALPELFAAKGKNDTVRVWVPGCSTGEEAYSLAIILRDFMEKHDKRLKTQIFATDIDERAVSRARSGTYPAGAVADVPDEYVQRWFRSQNGHYVISTLIREMMVFAPHDLIASPPFFRLDMVSCRNPSHLSDPGSPEEDHSPVLLFPQPERIPSARSVRNAWTPRRHVQSPGRKMEDIPAQRRCGVNGQISFEHPGRR